LGNQGNQGGTTLLSEDPPTNASVPPATEDPPANASDGGDGHEHPCGGKCTPTIDALAEKACQSVFTPLNKSCEDHFTKTNMEGVENDVPKIGEWIKQSAECTADADCLAKVDQCEQCHKEEMIKARDAMKALRKTQGQNGGSGGGQNGGSGGGQNGGNGGSGAGGQGATLLSEDPASAPDGAVESGGSGSA